MANAVPNQTRFRRDGELVVIEKTYDLLIWSLKHIERFPRCHRYGIGLRLEQRLSAILDLLLRAKYSRDRLGLLQETNVELELLRFQFRSVKDLKCLSIDSYGSAARFVNEIGQMVGGWIRSSQGQNHETLRQPVGRVDELSQPPAGGSQSRPR